MYICVLDYKKQLPIRIMIFLCNLTRKKKRNVRYDVTDITAPFKILIQMYFRSIKSTSPQLKFRTKAWNVTYLWLKLKFSNKAAFFRYGLMKRLAPHREPTPLGKCLRKLFRISFSNIGTLVIVFVYLIFGGFLFKFLENQKQIDSRVYFRKYRDDCIQELWSITSKHLVFILFILVL